MNAVPDLDDGHMLAVFKHKGHWGAIAKSNYNGIRGRDPVYKSLRELMMSYFDFYVNQDGVKTLKAYSDPVILDKVDPKRECWVKNNRRHPADESSQGFCCLTQRRARVSVSAGARGCGGIRGGAVLQGGGWTGVVCRRVVVPSCRRVVLSAGRVTFVGSTGRRGVVPGSVLLSKIYVLACSELPPLNVVHDTCPQNH